MTDDDREARLDDAVAAFHLARERGERPSAAEWVARHPDLAPDLERYFQMDGLVGWVADAEVPRAPHEGTRLGPYLIVRQVGRGGMGRVYEAAREGTGERVALKVLPSALLVDPRLAARFRREAGVLADLDHPNVLPILESREDFGLLHFAMPLVDGPDLRSIVHELRAARRSGEAPPPRAVALEGSLLPLGGPSADHARAVAAIGLQAAGALAHAHGRDVIHRDVKPSNLLLDRSGTVYVSDFGLARALDRDETSESIDLAGTLRYLPPERLNGPSDARGDLYGLGLVLYELLTLRPAFPGNDRSRLLRSIAQEAPRRPRAIDRHIPKDLERVVRKAIEREPSHRYPSAAAMGNDLRRFLDGQPVQARKVNPARRAWSWTRANKLRAAAVASIALAVIALGAASIWTERIRRGAAEAIAAESQFQAELLDIERERRADHTEGWSKRVMDRAQAASAKFGRDERLRDQATASLAGLDIVERRELKGVGGSSVAFNPEGTLLLIGGHEPKDGRDGLAGLYEVAADKITHKSRHPGPGPVAFGPGGAPLQLIHAEGIGLCLWGLVEDRVVAKLELPPGEPPSVLALSADGRLVAAGVVIEGKPTVRVWDGATGAILRDLPSEATALAFSPEGERLAAGHDRGAVTVWSPAQAWTSKTIQATDNRILAIAFTVDRRRDGTSEPGLLLAVGDAGAEIAIVESESSRVRRRFPGSYFEVSSLAFTSDGTILLSGGREQIRLWDASTGLMQAEAELGGPLTGLAMCGSGNRFAISYAPEGSAPKVTIAGCQFGRGITNLLGLTGEICQLEISPDSRLVAAMAYDWKVGIWNFQTGRLLWILEGPRGAYADNAALAFNADGSRLAAAAGRTVHLWDVDQGRLLADPWIVPSGLSEAIAIPSNAELLLCRFECRDGKTSPWDNDYRIHPRVVRFRNLLAPEPLGVIKEYAGYKRLNESVGTPDGSTFILSLIREGDTDSQQEFSVVDARTGRVRWAIDPQKSLEIGHLRIDSTGSMVGTDAGPEHGDTRFLVFDILTDSPVPTPRFALSPIPYALGPKGMLLADPLTITGRRRSIAIRTRISRAEILRLGLDQQVSPFCVRFSRDGRRILWGQSDGIVAVCDLVEVHSRLGPLSELGHIVASGLVDTTVKAR